MEERNLQQEITDEFANAFTSLSARVEVFQTTQESFVQSLIPQIQEVLPDLTEENLRVASAIYGICLTDEAIKNYEPSQFAQDVKYLIEIMPDEESTPEIIKEAEATREVNATNEMKSSNAKTLQERTKEAMLQETVFMATLASYYKSNSIIESALNELNNDIVLLNINNRAEIAITSILIRTHLLPLYNHIYSLYKATGTEIDLRFITSQIIFGIKNLIRENSENESQYSLFSKIKENYPLGHGDDLYWDLAISQIYSVFYDKLKHLLQPKIDEGIKNKEEAIETMRAQMNAKAPEQGTDESLRSKVDSMIFETIQFGRTFDGQRKAKLAQLIESLLKRMALKEYGVQDIANRERYTEYFMEEFFPVMLEYPQFLLPFIDIRYYRNFSDNPLEHFEKQKIYMMNQFWFRMRKNGYKTKSSSMPYDIANAFAELLYDILNDPKVLSFEV